MMLAALVTASGSAAVGCARTTSSSSPDAVATPVPTSPTTALSPTPANAAPSSGAPLVQTDALGSRPPEEVDINPPDASSKFDDFVARVVHPLDEVDASLTPVQDPAFDSERLMPETPDAVNFTTAPVPRLVAYWEDSVHGPVVLSAYRTGTDAAKSFEEYQRDAQAILDSSKDATMTNIVDIRAVQLGSTAGALTTTTGTRGVEFMIGGDDVTITVPIGTPEITLLDMASHFAAAD
jgi:hypothetical protein